MLLCLLASVVTYIVHQNTIRISRKGRHTLLNFCFHAALTFTVFAGGVNRTKYPVVCQAVGILLHYSTLATMLWIGVTARNIYKQVTRKAPPCPGADQPPYPRRPLLRYSGTHVCGHLYPQGTESPQFWATFGGLSKPAHRETWGPRTIHSAQVARVGGALGAGWGVRDGMSGCWIQLCAGGRCVPLPACVCATELHATRGCGGDSSGRWISAPVLATVHSWVSTAVLLTPAVDPEPQRPGTALQALAVDAAQQIEDSPSPAGPEAGPHLEARPGSLPACDALAVSLLQNEHSLKAQLRAAAFTLFLFAATWTFGALAVSQGHFLDMVFSCLYGAFCVTLGLFVLIHHCAKRDDVWHCWWSCCPSRGDAHPTKLATCPTLDTNGDALGHVACLQDSPCPGQPRGFSHVPAGHCKMTNLQAAQGHVNCLSPATPCCAKMHCEQLMEDAAHVHVHEEDAFGHDPHLHRCLQGRTKPPYFSRHRAAAAEQEYAYHIPSSLDGSPRSSRTDSPPSSLEGPVGAHTLACCAQGDPFPLVSQPEGSDTSPVLYGCPLRPGRESAHGPAHFETLRRTQSLPFGGPGQNGLLEGDVCEVLSFRANGMGNIRTGPWKNETTV
ncbi:adhesion G protein-coupled receptor A1 [Ailuropoda melanoleuca]|uniref:adhesion G protein-coupled receptor A1 n=1 Tax=Ailuropoda melanoleuca TaxID=9646 RepID=UPI00149436E4|nr:adhesion G protein-coupled receptor A1 [Ailuropoda melanoleuca]